MKVEAVEFSWLFVTRAGVWYIVNKIIMSIASGFFAVHIKIIGSKRFNGQSRIRV
jgi:hypothetical protein